DRRPTLRRERNAGNKVRALIVGVAIRHVGRWAIHRNVYRKPGARHHDRSEFPRAENAGPESRLIQIWFAEPERKLIDSIGVENMARIPDTIRALTWLTCDVLSH